jgi:hypothetical protein
MRNVLEWIVMVWDNVDSNIKLEEAEFIDMGQLSRDSALGLSLGS